jgi:hypothetical protein
MSGVSAPSLARRTIWCAALLLLLGPQAGAADSAEPPTELTLDDVEVRAARLRIDELRREMEHLEDQIYARYNAVNVIARFDVVCSAYARTGTRLIRRYCRPVFEDEAKTEEGRVAFEARQQIHDSQKSAGSVRLPDSPVPKILAQMPAFQRHMRKIMAQDPQLMMMLRQRAAVAEQMQRTRREMFGE